MNNWIDLGRQTLTNPRAAARRVLALNLPDQVWWTALALCAILSAAVMALLMQTVSLPDDEQQALPQFGGPIRTAMVLFAISAVTVWCMAKIGRMFGGRGSMSGALALSAWLQVVLTTVSLALKVLGVALPIVEVLAAVVLALVSIWVFVVFVAELHGFQSLALVFVGVIGASFLVASFLTVVAAATGLIVTSEG